MDSIFVSRAAITKYHRLDDLNMCGGWKSQIKIWKGLISDESSFPDLPSNGIYGVFSCDGQGTK